MTRLALFVSACSVFLASIWLLVGRHEAGVDGKTGSGNQSLANHPPQTFAGQRLHDTRPRDDNNALPPTRDLQGARPPKGRSGIRGISVDRANIVETVTMDDLRAPEGRLWIPAALSGPISKKSPNPLFNVLVAYCQLDMAAYHEAPWLFAMGTFHQRHSGCLDDKSLRLIDENPDQFMDPTGFIYHETRCGSTLSANMMAAVPSNIMHSETPPPIAALNLCAAEGKCSDGMREDLLRAVLRLMGPVQDGHTHSFFKFQSSKSVSAIEAAWPHVKWIYLFRDPLEVMASNLKGAWRKASRNETLPTYNLGGPCVRGVRRPAKGAGGKRPQPPSDVVLTTCAKQLESLNEVALRQINDGSPNGVVVEYRQLPEVITEFVYPDHFGMASTEKEREEFKRWMEPVTHMYSKGMATPQEAAVSKEYEQGMDLEIKEEKSDEAMRAAASTMCESYRELVSLQRWRKPSEGETMGTCSRRYTR